MPSVALIASDWTVFFAAVATAAATLAGLSFVAVSAHPPLLAEPHSRGRAQRSLVAFILVLIAGLTLTMPQLPLTVAAKVVFWLSLSGLYGVIMTIRRLGRAGKPLAWLRSAFDTPALVSLLTYALGAVWAGLHYASTSQPPDLTDLAAGMVAWLGWAAMQSWHVMLTGLQARLHAPGSAAGSPITLRPARRRRRRLRRQTERRPSHPADSRALD